MKIGDKVVLKYDVDGYNLKERVMDSRAELKAGEILTCVGDSYFKFFKGSYQFVNDKEQYIDFHPNHFHCYLSIKHVHRPHLLTTLFK